MAGGGILWWIIVGLIAGWLAGQVMKGGGYGVLADIVLGILEAYSAAGCLGKWVWEQARRLDRSSWRSSARDPGRADTTRQTSVTTHNACG